MASLAIRGPATWSVCPALRGLSAPISGGRRLYGGRGMEIVWYTAMSMDGRIASADHSLAFLDAVSAAGPNDFREFIAGVDGVLVRAATLRWLVGQGHGSTR